jgi:hypothetical protein
MCPLLAVAQPQTASASRFASGRAYHSGHSARPHRIKKARKHVPAQRNSQQLPPDKQDKKKPAS